MSVRGRARRYAGAVGRHVLGPPLTAVAFEFDVDPETLEAHLAAGDTLTLTGETSTMPARLLTATGMVLEEAHLGGPCRVRFVGLARLEATVLRTD